MKLLQNDTLFLQFDDVLLVPQYSEVVSRKDVDISSSIGIGTYELQLGLPIISSNMSTVTETKMANAMQKQGGIGCLHRFWSIEDNVKAYKECHSDTWGSVGVSEEELIRAGELLRAGCPTIVLDVAHGASIQVVQQTIKLRNLFGNDFNLVVGNFATAESLRKFLSLTGSARVSAVKSGTGPGSACKTRVVTGVGLSAFASLVDCLTVAGMPVICDGGIRGPGDFCKAMAVGACAVMMGGKLAGCDESPSEETATDIPGMFRAKSYKGSASQSSYEDQGKTASHRTSEGASFLVPYTGSLADTLQPYAAGLRSSMSYVGASNLKEYVDRAVFIKVSEATARESKPHGQKE